MRKRIYKNNLKALREKRGFTLTESAKEIGVSKAHLSNVENGYERASAKLINKIKDIYKPTDEEWWSYFISFTLDENYSPVSISSKELNHQSENTLARKKVFISQERKEVQVKFLWIPKKKKSQHRLLRFNLK